jgi:hypothetical protein
VTEGAGHTELCDVVVGVHCGLNADNCIQLEQRDRRRRALEIDFLEDPWRQHRRVHFESDLERGERVDALFDNLVQAQRGGPELLVTKRVEAENPLAFGDECR